MTVWWNFSYILLLFLFSIVSICHSQNGIYITEPKLLAVTPISSSALNITWQFAGSAYDQSTLIQVAINIYEFYFNYGPINTSINYTFTLTNQTITSVVQNFNLVNAFYYVCFASNSTYINITSLSRRTCQLKRTCSRSNSSICPQVPFVVVSSTDMSSNAFTIIVSWLKNLPYTRNTTTVQLASSSGTNTQLSTIENSTYTNLRYRFSGLQLNTNYIVIVTDNYAVFDSSFTDVINYTVSTTSRSSNFFYTCDNFIFLACSIVLCFLFS